MEKMIRQSDNGQHAAFTAVYDRYWSTIFYFVCRFIPDTARAEDITAETFVKLWQRPLEKFEHEKSIISFLHTTARNASIDLLRADKRQVYNRKELLYLLCQDRYDTPQDDVKAEVLRQVQHEIEKLPSRKKGVFLLSYVYGKTNGEIATLLGINNQSVRNHKTRAVKLLRTAITSKTRCLWCLFLLELLMAFI